MITYKVTHKTHYKYKEKVALGHNEAHLIPRELPYQHCVEHQLTVRPAPMVCVQREDYFGNSLAYFSLEKPHKELQVIGYSVVEVTPRKDVALQDSLPWEDVRHLLRTEKEARFIKAREFVFNSPHAYAHSGVEHFAQSCFTPGRPLLEVVMDLTHQIFESCEFDPHATTVSTPVETVAKKRKGVCQDFAHLAISCLRSYGLAAMYVSGYLETLPPPGQPKLQGSDASHAWISVYSPQQGWIDFDPTNNKRPISQYITLAWGRDYSDVTPLKGIIFGGGKMNLSVAVDMERMSV
jgi:transglutaminase-like putative cysteine protease